MPSKLVPVKLPPGIIKDWTDYSAEGRYSNGERVRFMEDLPEKIGGWISNSTYNVNGTPRSLLAWKDLSENNIIAIGTHSHLYIQFGGVIYDITPLRKTSSNVNNCFTVVDESTTVTVTDSSHGAETGDWVTIGSASAVGGITPSGNYQITVTSSNAYTIVHSAAGTSGATGGGASTDIEYAISSGVDNASGGLGWGAGTWSDSTWNTARTLGSGVAVELTYWSLSNYGEDLIATVRNGKTFLWDASSGVGTRAATLTNAPITAKMSTVSMETQHVLCYGAHNGSASDPMLVAWTDQGTNTTWAATATNTAGTYSLTRGTRIEAYAHTRSQTLIWTDTSLYGQTYSGQPYIFNFKLLSEDTTILSQTAAIDVDGTTYWFGVNNFYVYNGQVQVLQSPVRRWVYDNINRDVADKSFVGINKEFQEVWFFYPRGSNIEPSHYAAYYYGDPQKNIWHIGEMPRTCWQDAEKFLEKPIAYDSAGVYYDHENGFDDNTSALNPSLETGILELGGESGEGGNLLLIDKVIPEAIAGGNYLVEVITKRYPNSSEEATKGPYTISPTTEKISLRAKGRQARLKWSDTGVGYGWKLGTPRIQVRPMGTR